VIHLQKVKKFVAEALECSVFVNPREPGLTFAEINEIGARAGFREGEIGDAFVTMGLQTMGRGSKLLAPEQQTLVWWKFFLPETPEYRDLEAFDFVYSEFAELARNLGQAKLRWSGTLWFGALSRMSGDVFCMPAEDHVVTADGCDGRACEQPASRAMSDIVIRRDFPAPLGLLALVESAFEFLTLLCLANGFKLLRRFANLR
jgi:hypothetical protein